MVKLYKPCAACLKRQAAMVAAGKRVVNAMKGKRK